MVTEARKEKILRMVKNRSRFATVLLDGVSDPHNLAAVLRSLEGFGFQEAHAIEGGKVRIRLSRRVTRGADRWVDLFVYPSPEVAVRCLKERGYRLLLALPPGEGVPDLKEWQPLAPTCFVFGNEHEGPSPYLREHAEGAFTIPLYGMVESLNVSVAAAITLFYVRGRLGEEEAFLLTPEEQGALLRRYLGECPYPSRSGGPS